MQISNGRKFGYFPQICQESEKSKYRSDVRQQSKLLNIRRIPYSMLENPPHVLNLKAAPEIPVVSTARLRTPLRLTVQLHTNFPMPGNHP